MISSESFSESEVQRRMKQVDIPKMRGGATSRKAHFGTRDFLETDSREAFELLALGVMNDHRELPDWEGHLRGYFMQLRVELES
jgi:hypothetical protein